MLLSHKMKLASNKFSALVADIQWVISPTVFDLIAKKKKNCLTHAHSQEQTWVTNRGSEPAALQVAACLFFIHAVSLNLLSPQVSKCAPTKRAHETDSRADSCDSGSGARCETLVKTEEGLLKAWRGNLPWRYSSSALRCQRGERR